MVTLTSVAGRSNDKGGRKPIGVVIRLVGGSWMTGPVNEQEPNSLGVDSGKHMVMEDKQAENICKRYYLVSMYVGGRRQQ